MRTPAAVLRQYLQMLLTITYNKVNFSNALSQQPLQVVHVFAGMSDAYAETLTISNYIFTGLFTMEMILKLFALGFFEYIADSFNLFDGAVVILSILEIILDVSMLVINNILL